MAAACVSQLVVDPALTRDKLEELTLVVPYMIDPVARWFASPAMDAMMITLGFSDLRSNGTRAAVRKKTPATSQQSQRETVAMVLSGDDLPFTLMELSWLKSTLRDQLSVPAPASSPDRTYSSTAWSCSCRASSAIVSLSSSS